MIDALHDVVERHVARKSYATILDVGAWFLPYPRATHVVDMMPWETRGGRVQLQPNPGERFSKATWIALDLNDPAMRFPFGDKSIDFVMCSGTLEDLANPGPCVREMVRTGRAGYIRVPSMVCELTVGVEDRANSVIGYRHHHWICAVTGRGELTMMRKADAGLAVRPGRCIPLRSFENLLRQEPGRFDRTVHVFWEGSIAVAFQAGPGVRDSVAQYIQTLRIPACDYPWDSILRRARRMRDRLRHARGFEAGKVDWWEEMLRISEPYAAPGLLRRNPDRS